MASFLKTRERGNQVFYGDFGITYTSDGTDVTGGGHAVWEYTRSEDSTSEKFQRKYGSMISLVIDYCNLRLLYLEYFRHSPASLKGRKKGSPVPGV
jgi:hypothetical protein